MSGAKDLGQLLMVVVSSPLGPGSCTPVGLYGSGRCVRPSRVRRSVRALPCYFSTPTPELLKHGSAAPSA